MITNSRFPKTHALIEQLFGATERMKKTFARTLLALLPVSICSGSLHLVEGQKNERRRVAGEHDLVAISYELDRSLEELIASEEALRSLATFVHAEVDRIFATSTIEDPALERELCQAGLHAAILLEDWKSATVFLARGRALEEREDLQRIAGLHWEAWIQVCAAAEGSANPERLREPYEARLRALADAQPWGLVRGELARRAARVGFIGRGLLDRATKSVLGEAAEAGGEIEFASARELVPLLNGVRIMLPLKEQIASAYSGYLEAESEELADVWSSRQVILDPASPGTPVHLAVWDTGVDVALFPEQLWRNPAEEANGRDDDGNGYVDDSHGIAFGADLRPTPELLYPPHPDREVWQRAKSFNRGLSDVSATIDSPQARRLQRELARLEEHEVLPFMNELMHYALHAHGTHVAGIALEGNPFARLVVARVGLDHALPGETMTLSWAHRFAAMCLDTVDYFVAHDVRVVNMSWGFGVGEIEENLRDTGVAGTEAERSERARAIHAVLSQGIEAALASAPDILFVCGAGNSGEDSSRDRFVPSSLTLPNLITIGGVDESGGMAAFTSFGDHVRLYANGVRVESFVPGGDRVPHSGTSMSSPQVANLAAKLLALDPSLTPNQLVELMMRAAEPKQFTGREIFLLNPKASLALLRGKAVEPASAHEGSALVRVVPALEPGREGQMAAGRVALGSVRKQLEHRLAPLAIDRS